MSYTKDLNKNNGTQVISQVSDFDASLILLTREYLLDKNFDIINSDNEKVVLNSSIRFLLLDKFVYEKDIKITDKLLSVYSALYSTNTSFILKLVSNGEKCDFYIGIKKENDAAKGLKILKGAMEGNFPGTTFTKKSLSNSEIEKLQETMFNFADEVSCALGVATLKNKEEEDFFQGIENLIIAMQGKEFSALFLAEPIASKHIEDAKSLYEDIYTRLHPLKEQTINLSSNESIAVTEGITKTVGSSFSTTESTSETNSISKGVSKSESENRNPWFGRKMISSFVGTAAVKSKTGSSTNGTSENKTASKAQTLGKTFGLTENIAISDSESKTEGSSESCQFIIQDKKIVNILEKLDLQFDRFKKGESLGLWNVGTFFFSKEQQNSIVAANIYSGLIKGNDTGVEKSVVHTFTLQQDRMSHTNIINALKNYNLPSIKAKISNSENTIKLATIINTNELCIQASLPHKAFVGLDVVETAPFGNNIKHTGANTISVGHLYNYEKEFPLEFSLDLEKFTGHIFITGSTGSGKSNITYNLIENLIKKQIKFMVIEPAKGEYKNVFGNRSEVTVYGTNPNYSQVLKINPFTFPEEIHIYEHIDRLIEILNASWPMYAAMPAILKEAVEKVYESKGWDLKTSENLAGKEIYPTFKDLAALLPKLIANSGYSQEMISNYSGALVTRVKSMTNGIFQLIFTEEEIASEELFNRNTVIDLSRVASSETKSLIMGIMFMKLQEYRMSTATEANTKLKHVTIIEEAHNLLKNTSTEQGQESANLQGKSVEMISNAIAEMRTYGQGFILADQAPGLLDPSVIRNTNTKICLRLPSQEDRELVGKSMNLNDDQINELAKLKTGVAAIYQNDWQEAVLCKFNFHENTNQEYDYIYHYHEKREMVNFLANQLIESFEENSLNKVRLQEAIKLKKYYSVSNRLLYSKLDKDFIESQLCELLDIDSILTMTIIMNEANEPSSYRDLITYKQLLSNKWGLDIKSQNFMRIVELTLAHTAKKHDCCLPILQAHFSDVKNRKLINKAN
ncbi:ATP-binding protein [Aequorivita sinensis]|uniref:ATP-binding protein n=1 Tax=Aequorivita sinensis TaxID=1382458 RepID=UPI00111F653B|nr:ATP-binding protein [Aequorivita sinensis]